MDMTLEVESPDEEITIVAYSPLTFSNESGCLLIDGNRMRALDFRIRDNSIVIFPIHLNTTTMKIRLTGINFNDSTPGFTVYQSPSMHDFRFLTQAP